MQAYFMIFIFITDLLLLFGFSTVVDVENGKMPLKVRTCLLLYIPRSIHDSGAYSSPDATY